MGIDPSQYQGTIEQVVNQIAPVLVNMTFKAQLTHRAWQGQMRNNLGIFQKRDGAGAPTPITEATAAATPAPTQTGTPTVPAPVTTPPPAGMPDAAPPPQDPGDAPF